MEMKANRMKQQGKKCRIFSLLCEKLISDVYFEGVMKHKRDKIYTVGYSTSSL